MSVLSRLMNVEIYVVCSSLPLLNIRRNQHVVRFKFSSIGSEKIVIGLVGLLIFHPIIQPTSNSHVWNNLRDASKCFDLNELTSRIHRNMRIVVPENVDDEFELTNPLTYGIEVERVETDELINDFTADESLTLSQFIDRV